MNFKTKPCKQFFLHGYCSYGYRCQYLHSELKKKSDFQDFLLNVYFKKGISLSLLHGMSCEEEGKILKFMEETVKTLNFDEVGLEQVYDLIPHKR